MKKNLSNYVKILGPLIVALVVLWPTYTTYELEKKEKQAYAEAEAAETEIEILELKEKFRAEYGEDLEAAKNNALKLGLDLRGGMYVTLEVDLIKLIEETAQKDSKDEVFNKVIEKTTADAVNEDIDILEQFYINFDAIARPEGRSLITYFAVGNIKDASDEKIKEQLATNAEEAIEQAQEVIRQRIDKYGVAEPTIQLQGNRRIMLELPGVSDEREMSNLLETTARLEFTLVKNNSSIAKSFAKIDEILANENKLKEEIGSSETSDNAADNTSENIVENTTDDATTGEMALENSDDTASDVSSSMTDDNEVAEETNTATQDTSMAAQQERAEEYVKNHPFTMLFNTSIRAGDQSQDFTAGYENIPDDNGQFIFDFSITSQNLERFNLIMARSDVQEVLPYGITVRQAAKGFETKLNNGQPTTVYSLYAVKTEPSLVGDVIIDAAKNISPDDGKWVVNMTMNNEGAEKWATITGANVNKRIAIVLDGRVYSAPNVNQQITGGRSVIEGMANIDEANLLEIILKAGALKAPVKIMEKKFVGPSLGQDSISKGFNSSFVALFLVIIFMLVYYSKGGGVADIALTLNVLIILTILAALKGTLTLPGIAGIILTIGMAVDANILIFERIREELRKGRTIKSAVDEGFSKAMSAILDSNITTFLTGIILYLVGTGMIKGFALTLMIGIFGTLFTAVIVTRAIINISLSNGATHYGFGQPKTNN